MASGAAKPSRADVHTGLSTAPPGLCFESMAELSRLTSWLLAALGSRRAPEGLQLREDGKSKVSDAHPSIRQRPLSNVLPDTTGTRLTATHSGLMINSSLIIYHLEL